MIYYVWGRDKLLGYRRCCDITVVFLEDTLLLKM